uniref:Uncharacterized protein n=1 Tax=Anguilla anguilla TaxID=7936 RepID=A0A0E9T9N1_ANGAN
MTFYNFRLFKYSFGTAKLAQKPSCVCEKKRTVLRRASH